MDGTRRYSLRLSVMWRAVFLASAVMSFGFVVVALATGDPFTILTTLAFFGFGGFVVLKIMLRNSGLIELRDDGLLLDCYLSTGFILWDNLEPPRALKILGTSYLGLSTDDPQAYVDSRKQLGGLRHEGDRVLGQGFMRIMIALLGVFSGARTAVNVLLSVFGFAPLPKQFNEASLLEWNQQSYGAQIIIHKMWLPEFDALLRELHQRSRCRGSAPLPGTLPEVMSRGRRRDGARDAAPDPNLKACPMCAERVRLEARICRFCRYSFEEDRLLPAKN